METEAQLTAALDQLADALIDETSVRESLKHPAHAARLDPIRADAKAVLERFFRRQRRLVLAQIEPALRVVAVREAAPSDEAKAAALLALPDDSSLPNAVTRGMAVDFAAALEAALAGGYDSLAVAERTIAADVTAAYLREHSLETLAAQLDPTTVKRIQSSLADAYEDGADYDGLVEAVRDEFADMAAKRAETIAQTGMNSAYNAGRKQLGVDLGFNEKSWSADGPNPCPVCEDNEAAGWIPFEDPFPDGSDIPVAHVGCFCSLDVRASAKALAA